MCGKAKHRGIKAQERNLLMGPAVPAKIQTQR